jgi:hypothetical protein
LLLLLLLLVLLLLLPVLLPAYMVTMPLRHALESMHKPPAQLAG